MSAASAAHIPEHRPSLCMRLGAGRVDGAKVLEERNYRLSRCQGFAAFDPGGRIGVVADLEYASRSDRPDYLIIRRGLFRRRWLRVPVEQVVRVDLGRRVVVVHGAPGGRIRWRESAEELEKLGQDTARQRS